MEQMSLLRADCDQYYCIYLTIMSYPPIYVINLKRVPERRLYMKRQLDAFNLDYHFVDAIDKYDLDSKEYRTEIAKQLSIDESWMECRYEKYKTSGVARDGFPVSLSHIKIYNMMIENKIPTACILEDDAYLLSGFPQVLKDSQPYPWDILKLIHYSKTPHKILFGLTLKLIPFGYDRSNLSDLGSNPISLVRGLREYANRGSLYDSYRLAVIATKCVFRIIIAYLYPFTGWSKAIKEHLNRNMLSPNYGGIRYYTSMYYAIEMGGLAKRDEMSRHKISSNYRIVKPTEATGSTGGYMIRLEAAILFKRVLTSEYIMHIDSVFWKLHRRKKLNFYTLSPPCVRNAYQFLLNSSKDN